VLKKKIFKNENLHLLIIDAYKDEKLKKKKKKKNQKS
jgi:hypothetical protein